MKKAKGKVIMTPRPDLRSAGAKRVKKYYMKIKSADACLRAHKELGYSPRDLMGMIRYWVSAKHALSSGSRTWKN